MESITRSRLNTILSAAVGAVAAAATITILPTEPSRLAEERPRTERVREMDTSDVDRSRLERIERELAALRRRPAHEDAPRDAAREHITTDAEDLAPPPEPEQGYVEQQVLKEDWLTRYAMEAVDTNWARAAEQDIDLDLDRLKDQEWAGRGAIDFDVTEVSCRTSLCVVEVEWDSARTAVEDGAYLAMHDYAQNCTVTVFGPSPDEVEANAPFLQDVLFDCA
jgi:hypothetical protein